VDAHLYRSNAVVQYTSRRGVLFEPIRRYHIARIPYPDRHDWSTATGLCFVFNFFRFSSHVHRAETTGKAFGSVAPGIEPQNHEQYAARARCYDIRVTLPRFGSETVLTEPPRNIFNKQLRLRVLRFAFADTGKKTCV
jgi:hypothetical protein